MRFVTYRIAGERARPGVIEGDSVRTITTRNPARLHRARAARTHRLARARRSDPAGRRAARRTGSPARNVFCVGRNYLEHAKEGARAAGRELKLPSRPTFFTKAPTAIAAPGATLHLSAGVSREYDYEAELAVVIGARCKDLDERDARHVIFGFTALNDVTARDLQREHGQWFKGKSLDNSCPIGPWIVTPEELGDAGNLELRMRRNGVEKQHANTSKMIFSVARLIAELSQGMTLLPGDVIATGTPEGVGFARNPPEFLADGDVLEVEIERIGILRNVVSIT